MSLIRQLKDEDFSTHLDRFGHRSRGKELVW